MRIEPASPEALKLFRDGSLALALVEANGMRVDEDYLDRTIQETDVRIKGLARELTADKLFSLWRRRYGLKTKLGADQQLATVLFDDLKIPYLEEWGLTDTSRRRTDRQVLGKIDHPFVRRWGEWKQLTKVMSTYLLGIKRELVEGFLHPFFNLAGGGSGGEDDKGGAVSFRGSSSSPNAQNFPRRNPVMEKIVRPCFVSRFEGGQILELDYGTLEVRVAASVTGDRELIKYLTTPGTDMHRDSACDLFLLKPDQVCKATTRDAAKNLFVFRSFYGGTYFQAAPQLWAAMVDRDFRVGKDNDGIPVREHLGKRGARELGACDPGVPPLKGTFEYLVKGAEDRLWNERFIEYRDWKWENFRSYQQQGWFRIVTGFVVQGIGKGAMLRRNQVNNTPIQGSAFHCLLQSLIWLQRWLKKKKLKSLVTAQIHDSMLLDVFPGELAEVVHAARAIMMKELPRRWGWIKVPMDVDAEASPPGLSWFDKQKVSDT